MNILAPKSTGTDKGINLPLGVSIPFEHSQVGVGALAKRFLDIVVSCILLIILSPIMLAVSAAILFETGLPVLFTQERVGQDGRIADAGKTIGDLLSDASRKIRSWDSRY